MVELPSPPSGKSGWPWQPSPTAYSDSPWPRITVVTPSFNQGEFIEATLRSVLLQDYPNLEYIVLDGGSSDDSADIIRRHEPWLTYWHSQKDAGQADALRSGFARATGDILCWLNSDDIFLPGALRTAGALFRRHRRTDVIYGNRLVIDRDGNVIDCHIWPWHLTAAHWWIGQPLAQECCFFRRAIYNKVGGIDASKFFIMDYDLFFRMWRVGSFRKTTEFLGCFRTHDEAKNARNRDVWERELAEARIRFQLKEPGYLGRRLLNRLDWLQNRGEDLMVRLRRAPRPELGVRSRSRSD
jgi:glycosyltransferase involved in cell wall biosynthesis